MQQICANGWCNATFEITDDDLVFYDKVSPSFGGKQYAIPPPTKCPECRRQNRLVFRNERNLYRRTCDATGRSIISVYSPDNAHTIYEADAWWSDTWDPFSYAQDVDFQRPFFDQFADLYKRIPHIALYNVRNENCEYVNQCGWSKNCYMAFMTDFSEDCLYTDSCIQSKDCVDSIGLHECERCYESLNCSKCHTVHFSRDCKNCHDCAFCSMCSGCSCCFGCTNLRNKQYVIFNEQVTRDAWEEFQRTLTYSPSSVEQYMVRSEALRLASLHLYAQMTNCENCTGDYLSNCSNARSCFDGKDITDGKYLTIIPTPIRDAYDVTGGGGELLYYCYSTGPGQRNLFCGHCWDGVYDLLYCTCCMNASHHCFGCAGLRKASYCILNKQYTKEEYEALVPRIIDHMRSTGEWGEFFSPSMSPFGYNETVADQYFPLRREDVLERGWPWLDYEAPPPHAEKIVPGSRLPESIDAVPDDILQWVVECARTHKPFRITKQELQFYRAMRLPVPRLHPNERYRVRVDRRNPLRLWPRSCAQCQKPIATSYAPDRPEKVVCEACYLKEVY